MKPKYLITTIAVFIGIIAAIVLIVTTPRGKSEDSHKVSVTATYYPLYDFAKNIGGEKITATNATPPGSEPHDYEPTPQQLISTQKSDVFIYNGSAMEPWVEKFLPEFKNTTVKASSGIDLAEGEVHGHDGEETGHKEEATHEESNKEHALDPHFWLDPVLAQEIVNNIRDGLVKADPNNQGYYTSRADIYKQKLAQLDKDYSSTLATCQHRTIITSHEAFGYLGKRYNLEIAAITGLAPDQEPSPAKLAELTELIRSKNINFIFFESLASPKLAETLANETKTKTAVFDPIEGLSNEDQKQGKDYISIQRENLAALKNALACQ